MLVLERRFSKQEERVHNTSPVELTNAIPVIAEIDVVTPSYINEQEGVTTKEQEFQAKPEERLTPQDIQTGVNPLTAIAQKEA